MKVYALAVLRVRDGNWVPSYREAVTPLVLKHGGKYLARTPEVALVEGNGPAPSAVALIEWPSREAAEAFYNDPAYRPHREARMKGADGEFYLFDAEDSAARK